MSGSLCTVAAFALTLWGCAPQQRDASADPDTKGPAPQPRQSRVRIVRDVTEGRVAAGDTVALFGRCLGLDAAAAAGPPPRSRSDWQFADSTGAVYVSGGIPQGCELGGSARPALTLRATVARDTIQAFPQQARRVRYFLVAVP